MRGAYRAPPPPPSPAIDTVLWNLAALANAAMPAIARR
jgi:hypothetical protein